MKNRKRGTMGWRRAVVSAGFVLLNMTCGGPHDRETLLLYGAGATAITGGPASPIPSLVLAGLGVGAVGDLTGGLIDGFLTQATNGLLEHAREIGQDISRNLRLDAEVAIRQLRLVLKDNVNTPLKNLGDDAKVVADRALLVATQITTVLSGLQKCTAQDVRAIAAGIEAGLTAKVNQVAFWSGKESYIATASILGGNSRLGVRVTTRPTIYRMEGVFDRFHPDCSSPAISLTSPSGKAVSGIRILNADARAVTVELPPLEEEGAYVASFSYKMRTTVLHNCGLENRTLSHVIPVTKRPKFTVEYKVVPKCTVTETRTLQTTLDFGNNECHGDKTDQVQLCPPNDAEYVNHWFNDDSRNGCDPARIDLLPGGCVRASGRCPEKGGFFCTGAGKWLAGRLSLVVRERHANQAGTAISGAFPEPLEHAQTRRIQVVDPATVLVGGKPTQACSWTVSGSVTDADGTPTDFPSVSGDHPLTTVAGGFVMQWNPVDGNLAVSTPAYACDLTQ